MYNTHPNVKSDLYDWIGTIPNLYSLLNSRCVHPRVVLRNIYRAMTHAIYIPRQLADDALMHLVIAHITSYILKKKNIYIYIYIYNFFTPIIIIGVLRV